MSWKLVLGKGMVLIWVGGGGKKCHEATPNGMRFKTYKLFISGIFHLILEPWLLQVTGTIESETPDNGGGGCVVNLRVASLSIWFLKTWVTNSLYEIPSIELLSLNF